MKIFKILGITILTIFTIITLFLVVSTVNHKIKLRKETKAYLPSGSMVDVNDKGLHVCAEGEGDITLVFMSGHGTISPTIDFKPLWMRMVDDYRIAVVEKSGYGWSEVSNSPRDIDTVLEETRKALELSGEKGPYVLFPHSMSGLEAIYWSQKYPDEVKAIIGLDPVTPETYDILPKPEKIQLYTMYLVSRTGLSRSMPNTEIKNTFPLMNSEDITDEEKQAYLAVFYQSAYSKDMLREVDYLMENAKTVAENDIPSHTPMYFFISDDQDTKVSGWKETSINFLSDLTVGKYRELATGHYVHYEKSEIIAEEAKAFIDAIK